jgi:hypothetical protein
MPCDTCASGTVTYPRHPRTCYNYFVINQKPMLTLDSSNVYQNDYQILNMICMSFMEHYNFMLGLSFNTEVENSFFQEEFDQYKLYDC